MKNSGYKPWKNYKPKTKSANQSDSQQPTSHEEFKQKYTVTARTKSGGKITPFHGNTKKEIQTGLRYMKRNKDTYHDIKIKVN